ncbi:unnamed protein product [Brachionus calyciflorus]|uniref:Integrase catalytic domain-containing protein n=1 Tax=Brachionus calyciflorus TaxID=104777 RepID=A0A813UZK3_9BILA|nr:unnamed protein product [Brachionus calyciflorus]
MKRVNRKQPFAQTASCMNLMLCLLGRAKHQPLSNVFKTHLERLDEFVMDEVGYLGYKNIKYGLCPDPAKTAAINNLSAPANKDDVKRFLGMMGYFRRFIPNISKTAACLFELTKAKNKFEDEGVNRYGTPAAIITDQGRNFESKSLKEYCDQNKIKKLRTTANHPQCNRLTERTIRTIKQMLSMYVNESHNNWDEILQPVIFAFNISKHSSTNYAPNKIIFEKLMPTTADWLCDVTQGNPNESNLANSVKFAVGIYLLTRDIDQGRFEALKRNSLEHLQFWKELAT